MIAAPCAAVVVFAKAPRAGRVKTRMCPPLTPEQAAELYAAMLDDVLAATAELCASRCYALYITVHPSEECTALAAAAPASACVVAQRGADLSARMEWAIAEAAAAGHERVAIRGSDSPALDPQEIECALAALGDADVALSPDVDGGYNVLAARQPVPGLFDHEMSTASVAGDTLGNARRLGLRARELDPSFDLDRIGDLVHLAALRARDAEALERRCPRTLELIDRHDWWQVAARP